MLRESHIRRSHEEDKNHQHLLGQTEIEAAALAKLALCSYHTDRENLTQLAVFLDDPLAVDESKTMTLLLFPVAIDNHLTFKQML